MANKKRKDGYIKKSFTFNHKKYYVYGHNQKELFEKEAAKREELETGMNDLKNPTLNSYYQSFTQIRGHEVSKSTLRSQKIQFKEVAEVEISKGVKFGDMKIRDITRRDIEKVREILLHGGKSAENLNIIFGHLNHVFATAVIDDTINKNPCKALKRLKRDIAPINETKHRALTEQETKLFFDAAYNRKSFYRYAFMVMIKTGIRIGELAALTFEDIDSKAGFIHIKKTVTRDEVGGYYIGDATKTKSGIRDIPLTRELYDIFRKQRALNAFIFRADKSTEKDLLFRSSEGTILREYTVNREIKRVCKTAGIDYFTCHAFRNTFATRFIEQRPQDYKILAEILGHKNISITLNLYTHVMTENKVKAMENVEVKTS